MFYWERCWLLTFLGGLQSLQAAIEGYSLNVGQAGSIDVREGEIGAIPSGSLAPPNSYTAWASVFPTKNYIKNDFYRSAPDQHRKQRLRFMA